MISLPALQATFRLMSWLLIGAAASGGLSLAQGTVSKSASEDLIALQQKVQSVIKKVTPATVGIEVGGDLGSGVIISKDGHILTAAHVIGEPGQSALIFLADGRKLRAKTMGVNHYRDSGLLILDQEVEDLPYVNLAPRGSRIGEGDWCVALGHPGGYDRTRKPVARIGRVLNSHGLFVQSDCPINVGDSGGPLINLEGQIIGIHSRIEPGVSSNFHVPYNTFRNGWERLASGKTFRRSSAHLGVRGRFLPSRGYYLEYVNPRSSAFKAGLRGGDLIHAVDGFEIQRRDDLKRHVQDHVPGDLIIITARRGSKPLEFEFKIDGREMASG